MQHIKIGAEMISYTVEKGTVMDIENHTENIVSGHSGGHVINGTIQSGSVRSHSVLHQHIFLQDSGGRQFSASLKNWNLSAMNGHELVLIKARSNHYSGYGLIYNKTLDRVYIGVLPDYFRLENETDRKGRMVLAVVAAIGFPVLAYGVTKSEDIGAAASIIALIFFVLVLQRNKAGKNKGVILPMEMKAKLEKILKENIGA